MTKEHQKEDIEPNPQTHCADSTGNNEKIGGTSIDHPLEEDSSSFFRQVNIEFLVHELKDPVSVIETGVIMLLEKQGSSGPLSQIQERTLTRVLRNANKTREMLNQLLEVGRAANACFNCHPFMPVDVLQQTLLEAVEKSDPDLYEEVKSASNAQASISFLAKKGMRIDIAPSAEGMTIVQDQIKFSQIVANLIKNGIFYRRRQLLIHLSYQHNQMSIAVRDDGPGIAPEHHEEIFKRYKQVMASAGVARSGHGLGLAVARMLARSMGGDITIESQLGHGALFRFILPVDPPF